MKIEANKANLAFNPADRAERVGAGRSKNVPAGHQSTETDRVQLSGQAAALAAAQRQAAESPDLRQDVIARVSAKLEAGDVGADAERLAERLIDHLLGS